MITLLYQSLKVLTNFQGKRHEQFNTSYYRQFNTSYHGMPNTSHHSSDRDVV
jgi:hypothetical protein